MRKIFYFIFTCMLIANSTQAARAANLIVNPGFESPLVPVGGYTTFYVGGTTFIPGWVVTGEAGNVALVNKSFTQGGLTFQAVAGNQSLDLTGTSQTPTGVQQTVATTVGAAYLLNFWVGNVFNNGGIFGTSSTVNVFVNGQLVTAVLNNGGSGTAKLLWRNFSARFTASAAATTVAFINADPGNDTSNFIDNVSLTLAP